MSLQRKLTGVGLTLGLILTFNIAAFAQGSAQEQQQDNGAPQRPFDGRGKRRGDKRGPRGMMRLMHQLNLSDAQQQQIRAIHDRLEASIKPQREEMRRLRESNQDQPSADTIARIEALHTEMGRVMRATHEEVLAVLTPEQRAQLEQLKKERKARHGERRGGRRSDMPDNNDDQ